MNSKTTRCALFQEIASEIWYEIIYHHQVGVNVPEIGITNRIIAKLLHNKNCGVWANPGYKEDEFGSDLDIFVETTTGSFVWYALQAKVLKKDGCYHGVKEKRQWEKLEKLQESTGCISNYLLYNGVKESTVSSQFGCSLVELEQMASVAMIGKPKFTDFHPDDAMPWNVIVCCKQDISITRLFSTDEIRASLSRYESIQEGKLFKKIDKYEYSNHLAINIINNESGRIGRNLYCRIVVRTNAGLTASQQ